MNAGGSENFARQVLPRIRGRGRPRGPRGLAHREAGPAMEVLAFGSTADMPGRKWASKLQRPKESRRK